MAKIKRSLIKSFLDVGSGAYKLIGDGVTTGLINYNPQVVEENYIHEDSPTIVVESYAPNFPVEMTAIAGDGVFDYLDGLRIDRKILDDVETYLVNVWLYKDNHNAIAYYAEKQKVSLQIDSSGGDGGVSSKLNYTINFIGDPEKGIMSFYVPATPVFYAVDSDALLTDLEISTGGVPETLSPTFSDDFLIYTATMDAGIYLVEADSEDPTLTVKITHTFDGTPTVVDEDTGTASGNATISVGENIILVEVKEGSTVRNSYLVYVTGEAV